MGVAVSNWRLARRVSLCGGLGVVSGTGLDTVFIRRLQDGDLDGAMRRALAAFPVPGVAGPILDRWLVPGGKDPGKPYRMKAPPTVVMKREALELLVVGSFVEIWLAKEGHDGPVGINLLEKIQLPNLPTLFGAMLAGVDAVLMGGGIPLGIPAALDALAKLEPAELKLNVTEGPRDSGVRLRFAPRELYDALSGPLHRPLFIAVISTDILATTLVRKAGGRVDGFVVEHHRAGGHNAPPRGAGGYGPRDGCNLDKLRALGLPFWLAGGCASPDSLLEAIEAGACGIQVGSAFALTEESGIRPDLKRRIIDGHRDGTLEVVTDFQASPTGYPLKRAILDGDSDPARPVACDLGYLREVVIGEDGKPAFRCPAGPITQYLAKGGDEANTEGKRCLCNGLMATVGFAQVRDGEPVLPLITLGEDLSFLDRLPLSDEGNYSAADVMDYLGTVPAS